MRSKPTRRIAAALGLAVIISAFTGAAPAMAVPELRAPFGEAPVWTDVVAAWGESILVDAGYNYRLTTDNGKTWQPSALGYSEDEFYLDSVSDGKATFADGNSAVAVLDLASNQKTEYTVSGYQLWAANSQTAVGWDRVNGHPFVALPLAGGAPVDLDEAYLSSPPADFDDYEDFVYIYPGTAVHLTNFILNNNQIATDINVMPLNGTQGVDPFRVNGYVAYAGINGDKVEWVKKVSTTVSLCTKPLAGGAEACSKVATLSSSKHSVWAERSGSAMTLELNGVEYIWEANTLKKVTYPGSYAIFEGMGNPSRPLVRVQNGTVGGIHQVLAGGSAPKLFDDLTIPVRPYELDLSADKLAGVDRRDPGWVRSITSSIGGESLLPGRASEVKVSAGRMVLNSRSGLSFYDQAALKSTTTAVSRLIDVSGPYALTQTGSANTLRTRTGAVAATSPQAIFGSTYVGRGADGKPFFRDLASSSNESFADFSTLPGTWKYRYTKMWGDFVAIEMDQVDESTNIYVSNKRGAFQERVYTGGWLVAMGDGVAVVENDSSEGYVLWNFVTDERTPLGGEEVSTPTVDDGNRLAFADPEGLVVTTVDGMGESAPRLLGAVAASTFNPNAGAWAPEFDATKALAAGTLEISHGSGAELVVDRVLDVPATNDGSMRGIVWNGKNTAGEWVPDGAYNWTLKTTDRDDAAKALVAVDGTSPAAGVVTVKAANLGTVTPATPKLSDTTPTVDQTLTALPGTWKPTNPLFSYKWYRDTTVIKDATAATYLVTPADAGHTLKVTVTGSCPGTDTYCRGYASASKSSAVTAKVAKATITPAPVPFLDDTTPTVDQAVTGTIGTWGPDPVSLSYQWY
ncbi:MAG: hypothetical protein IT193_17215, partial [Propionibacteriaceae bacterium]|nr:hypothetical protein [Propionibacteriaceae bacterium]